MYRSHWNRPRPAYAAVVEGSSNRNDRGSRPDDENTVEANNQRVLLLDRDDRLNTAGRKQNAFLNKILLETQRRQYAKGNIVTFLYPDIAMNQLQMHVVTRALRTCGFKVSDIVSVKLNDYRTNQAEVMLKDDVQFSLSEMDRKLKDAGIEAVVNTFDCVEEVLMIYGLPLTNDFDGMKKVIQETIAPFVKSVGHVVPCTYGSSAGEFFSGKYNGNWHVRVSPRADRQIPNFIVLGHDSKVMGKAKYVRKVYDRKEMCSDCFSTDHFRLAGECPGPRKWDEYCKEFEESWELNRLDTTEEEERLMTRTEEDSRYMVMNRALQKDLENVENEKLLVETRLKDQQELLDKIDSLEAKVGDLTAENERYRVVGNLMCQGSRTTSQEDLNDFSVSSGSDSNPLKLTDKDKERLRSSTAGNFLSDIDLDSTEKELQDGDISLPASKDQVEDEEDDEDDNIMRKSYAKTDFAFKYSDEKPAIEFHSNIRARFIDSDRYLYFYLLKKCKDDDKCCKYFGRGTTKKKHFEWDMKIDLENIEWEYEHWSDGM